MGINKKRDQYRRLFTLWALTRRGTSRQSIYTVSIGEGRDQYRRQTVYTVNTDEEKDQETEYLYCGHW